MQKSKSSSNVGQFVSKKIWKSRSKSQTRTSSPTKPYWTPQGNCVWTSTNGKRIILSDLYLHDLTDVEKKLLHKIAIEKINQLNIGVNVTAPEDVGLATTTAAKPQKRRPLLIKRKALTTSFFDTGKKDDTKGVDGGGLVFGVSLEKCLDNDDRIRKGSQNTDRGSRNSIVSLLGGSNSKGSENIGSCESLPSRTNFHSDPDETGFYISPPGIQTCRSQSDIRRSSQNDDKVPECESVDRTLGQHVPLLVRASIRHLEEYGLHTVGIFRVSTSKKRVRQLREDFDRGERTSFDPDTSPHDVATILKEYLRDLPEPLLCRNLYKAFVKTQKIRNRRLQLEALSHLVQLLPIAHRDTLYVLLRFLAKIVAASDDITTRDGLIISPGNRMDSSNLATVFAPNILHCWVPGQNTYEQEIDEQIDVINVVRAMIDHYKVLFKVPAELLDEIYTNMMDIYPEQLNYLCEKRDIHEKLDDDIDTGNLNISISTINTTGTTTTLSQSDIERLDRSDTSQDHGQRRIYVRQDFLHENAMKGDPNSNSDMALRRRRRDRFFGDMSSTPQQKTHGGDASNSTRLNFDNTHSKNSVLIASKHRSSSIDLNLSVEQQQLQRQQQAVIDSTSRRLSSPYVLHGGNNVVTASLKIPVQKHSQQQQSHGNSYGNGSTSKSDLSDIPYIEDSSFSNEAQVFGAQNRRLQQDSRITGRMVHSSTSGSTSPETTKTPFLQFEDDSKRISSTLGSSSSGAGDGSGEGGNSSSQKNSLHGGKRSDSNKRSSRKQSGSGFGLIKAKTYGDQIPFIESDSPDVLPAGRPSTSHPEPKISPSITNIGGAVLKSKTADFERILVQNKKYKSNDAEKGDGKKLRDTNVNTSSGNTENLPKPAPRGPIYKRQELILSAQDHRIRPK